MSNQTFKFNEVTFDIQLGTLDELGTLKFINPPHESTKTVIQLKEYDIDEKGKTIKIINETWKEEVNGLMIEDTWKKEPVRIYDDQPTEQGIKLYTMYATLQNQPLPNWEIYRRARINEALENLYKKGILDRFVYCYDPFSNWSYKQPVEVNAIVHDESSHNALDGSLILTVSNAQVDKTYQYAILDKATISPESFSNLQWVNDPTFTGLAPSEYLIFAKCVEDDFIGQYEAVVEKYVEPIN